MEIHRWWQDDSAQQFWLEITDRGDLGDDLNAPQTREDGKEYYGYSLIREVAGGDTVFHYDKRRMAIVALSQASGDIREDQVTWGSHGATARGSGVQPYVRPGWRRGLSDFRRFQPPTALAEIRALQPDIEAIFVKLEKRHGTPLYSPFELSQTRDLRPTQAYLSKVPAEVVKLFPDLWTAAQELRGTYETISVAEYERLADDRYLDPDAPLDGRRLAKVRKEQQFLRTYLFRRKAVGTCGLCGRDFPVELLVAAHIKPRSRCTDSERRDYKNLVMPMCKLGCDDLYEHGYIAVDSHGTVTIRKASPLSAAVMQHLQLLQGRECKYWSSSTEPYFKWHRLH